jgi:hypothetical protein
VIALLPFEVVAKVLAIPAATAGLVVVDTGAKLLLIGYVGGDGRIGQAWYCQRQGGVSGNEGEEGPRPKGFLDGVEGLVNDIRCVVLIQGKAWLMLGAAKAVSRAQGPGECRRGNSS